jgi:hypothetical protein
MHKHSFGMPAWPAALGLFILAAGSANAAWTNLTHKLDLTLRETFDSNVYLQDVEPDLAQVPQAAQPFRESFVTSITPRVSLSYHPAQEFGVAVSYAPEVVFYHSEPSEDHVSHRGSILLRGTINDVAWEQPNNITWIDGGTETLYFGGPGGMPAIGGVPIRDRRAALVYRGGFRATWNFAERFFLRPVASAYVHEFFTEQRTDRGYANFVDRNDVNGGLDAGLRVAENTRAFVGYRYGFQDEGHLITEPSIEYDNEYHRVLFGIEGQPLPWLKLAVALGPSFHHSTARTRADFDRDYTILFVDSAVTLLPTSKDSVIITVRQFTQPAFGSCSIYEDRTFDLAWRHTLSGQWLFGAGFRAYAGDWLSPVQREDWIYTASGQVAYTHNAHLNAELTYSYDWAESRVPNREGREFTRHLVSLAVRYAF